MQPPPPILDYQPRDRRAKRDWYNFSVMLVIYGSLLLLLLAFLVGALFPVVNPRGNPPHSATIAELSNLKAALAHFELDTARYPTTAEGLEALVTSPPALAGWEGPYIESVPVDKWGHPYLYQFPNPANPATFDLHSAGEDGVDGTADDLIANP